MSTADEAGAPRGGDPDVPPRVLNLTTAFGQVAGLWRPHVVADLNGQQIKLARIRGAFDWHAHPGEDEAFLVVRGRMRLEFDNGVRELGEGDLCVVPRGTRHRPVADDECHIVLFEPAGTVNTGDAPGSRTVRELPHL